MFRHLNNVAIGQFYEEARFALAGEARALLPRESKGRMVVVNVDTAYLREARYPGDVTICTGIVSRGAKSFTVGQALFQNGGCFSAADTIIVYMDEHGSAAIPQEVADYLDGLIIQGF